jgi:DnaJ-class molecular chaperone
LNTSRVGDLLVRINIITPKKMSGPAKRLIQELSKELPSIPEYKKFK